MSNVLAFKRPEKKQIVVDDDGDELPDDAVFCCGVCSSHKWELRHDGKIECEAGHIPVDIDWGMMDD